MNTFNAPLLNQDEFQRDFIIARISNNWPNYYLPHELPHLEDYFQSMVSRQSSHGSQIGEAMEQGAETFHDNAPAEALVSDQEVLVNAVKLLRSNVNNAKIVQYPQQSDRLVTIGSICSVDFGDGDTETMYMAGDSTGYNGKNFDTSMTITSVRSPIGQAILGAITGDTVETLVENGAVEFGVIHIVNGQFS